MAGCAVGSAWPWQICQFLMAVRRLASVLGFNNPAWCFNIHNLKGFTGSEEFFRHPLNRRFIYTEGIAYLAKQAACYWLIDKIAVDVFPRIMRKSPDHFYCIEFVVSAKQSATIVVDDGNGNICHRCKIARTDFPVKGIPLKFYLVDNGSAFCFMLPSEY